MKRSRAGTRKQGSAEPREHVFQHPDGFYWRNAKGEERGPFESRAEAEADLLSEGSEYEPSDTLQEAESEAGISDWIDPDTGGPAEDSVPHIDDN
jgi:hypothetical protein